MDKLYYVYILASRSRNLYTGVTHSLLRRVIEHRLALKPGLTSKYRIFRLVYYEIFGDIHMAIVGRRKSRRGGAKRKCG